MVKSKYDFEHFFLISCISSFIFREHKQKDLQRQCEARMALFWQENGEFPHDTCPRSALYLNLLLWDVNKEHWLSCASNASSSAAGCCGLRMGDVVLHVPQSYPFCSHRPCYLCQDFHPLSSKGACMCVNACERALQLCVCIFLDLHFILNENKLECLFICRTNSLKLHSDIVNSQALGCTSNWVLFYLFEQWTINLRCCISFTPPRLWHGIDLMHEHQLHCIVRVSNCFLWVYWHI